jgi:hypothetical protein
MKPEGAYVCVYICIFVGSVCSFRVIIQLHYVSVELY